VCAWGGGGQGGVCGLKLSHTSSSFISNVHCRYQVPMVWLSPYFMWGNVGIILGSFSLLSPMRARVCVRAGCVCDCGLCLCQLSVLCVCVCGGGLRSELCSTLLHIHLQRSLYLSRSRVPMVITILHVWQRGNHLEVIIALPTDPRLTTPPHIRSSRIW
jgi:hypothetical protein